MVKQLLKWISALIPLFLILVFCKLEFIGKNFDPQQLKPYLLKQPAITHSIKLTYLGTSGFIISYKGKQLVCDPFFSNPNLISSAFGNISYPPLADRIDSNLFNQVKLITLSHGHYDHCLDIANFLNTSSNTTVVGDLSILNQLATLFKGKNIVPAPVRKMQKKAWIYASDSSFRAFALPSTHSPQFANITLFTGHYEHPLAHVPASLWNWKLGECNSYLLDILDDDSVYFRILISTGNMDPDGLTDLKQLVNERKVNLLLPIFWKSSACTANLKLCYSITHPDLVILHHWNNFFRSNNKSLQYLRSSEFPESIDVIKQAGIDGKIMIPFSSVEL